MTMIEHVCYMTIEVGGDSKAFNIVTYLTYNLN